MKPYGINGRKIRWWIKDKNDRNLCSGTANVDNEGNLFPVSHLDALPVSLEEFIKIKDSLKNKDKRELIVIFAASQTKRNDTLRANADSYYATLYKTYDEIISESCDFQIAPAGYRPNWDLNELKHII